MADFLTSGDGVLIGHAIILFAVAVVGYFTARVNAETKRIRADLVAHKNGGALGDHEHE